MNENIKIMLEKLARDEESLKKLAAVRDPDEAYAIVSAIQGDYTKEEFVETMRALNEQLGADLTNVDLSRAAGGDVTAIVGSATASAAMTAFTAAVTGSSVGTAVAVSAAVGAAAV